MRIVDVASRDADTVSRFVGYERFPWEHLILASVKGEPPKPLHSRRADLIALLHVRKDALESWSKEVRDSVQRLSVRVAREAGLLGFSSDSFDQALRLLDYVEDGVRSAVIRPDSKRDDRFASALNILRGGVSQSSASVDRRAVLDWVRDALERVQIQASRQEYYVEYPNGMNAVDPLVLLSMFSGESEHGRPTIENAREVVRLFNVNDLTPEALLEKFCALPIRRRTDGRYSRAARDLRHMIAFYGSAFEAEPLAEIEDLLAQNLPGADGDHVPVCTIAAELVWRAYRRAASSNQLGDRSVYRFPFTIEGHQATRPFELLRKNFKQTDLQK